jgi:hypothetical protein
VAVVFVIFVAQEASKEIPVNLFVLAALLARFQMRQVRRFAPVVVVGHTNQELRNHPVLIAPSERRRLPSGKLCVTIALLELSLRSTARRRARVVCKERSRMRTVKVHVSHAASVNRKLVCPALRAIRVDLAFFRIRRR